MSEYKPLEYNTGNPEKAGVYAVRVPADDAETYWDDIFLTFFDGAWSYPSSSVLYRDPVKYWIGPLQRKMTKTQTQL